jgi:hypothetical protein
VNELIKEKGTEKQIDARKHPNGHYTIVSKEGVKEVPKSG